MKNTKTTIISLLTITAFSLYIITDSIEILQSGISSFQMVLTYICMAAIPFAVMGLYVIDEQKGKYFILRVLFLFQFLLFILAELQLIH